SIVANFTQGGTFSTAEEDQRIGRLALATLSKEKVNAEFARVWSKAAAPQMLLVSAKPEQQPRVLSAWRLAEAAPAPGRPAERQGRAWAYSSFGAPGKVVSREALPDIDAAHIAFANGLRLNFKSSQNAQDRVEIRIRFGAGQEELAAKDLAAARLGATLLREGGLAKNDFEDTVDYCAGHECDFSLSVNRPSFDLPAPPPPSHPPPHPP